MGRQAANASRPQEWQESTAGSRGHESAADMWPSEDEHGGSTRIPSSGAASPSASSAGLDVHAEKKSAAQIQKEKEERARWADVESDGEEVIVFPGGHRNGRAEVEGWATISKKPGRGAKPPPPKSRPSKPDPPPPPPRQPAAKPVDNGKYPVGGYRSQKSEAKYEEHNESSWYEKQNEWESAGWGKDDDAWSSSKTASGRVGEAWPSSKGRSGRRGGGGGDSWDVGSRGGGDAWDEGSWSQKTEVQSSKADYGSGFAEEKRSGSSKGGYGGGFAKEKARGGGGGGGGFAKEKNESFKRGPSVAVNMESSRLNW